MALTIKVTGVGVVRSATDPREESYWRNGNVFESVLGRCRNYDSCGVRRVDSSGDLDGEGLSMSRSSLYSEAQWEWVAKKHLEGYSYHQLGEFLGFSEIHVLTMLRRRGLVKVRKQLPPLESLKKEFLEL